MLERAGGDRPQDGTAPGGTAAGGDRAARSRGTRGPFTPGLAILALFQLALGAWWLGLVAGMRTSLPAGLADELLARGDAGQVAVGVLGVLRLAAAVGLVARLRAAWVLAMLLTGIGLAGSLVGYALGRPDDLLLLLEVLSAFYLNQPEVRATFGDPRVGTAT